MNPTRKKRILYKRENLSKNNHPKRSRGKNRAKNPINSDPTMKYGIQTLNAWPENPKRGTKVANFLKDLAIEADKAEWDGFFLWDHILYPWTTPVADAWTVLAAASTATKTIKLGTTVTPVTRRRPQVLARQLVTLNQLSGGRVILGAGLGGGGGPEGAGAEFSQFGEESDYRFLAGKADEALEVITGLWSGEEFTFTGNHYTATNVTYLPVQTPRIPIWVGGSSRGAVARAARFDGWFTEGPSPTVGVKGLTPREVGDRVARIKGLRGPGGVFDVCYSLEFPEDEGDLQILVEESRRAGVTWLCEMVFGAKHDVDAAFERVRQGPPASTSVRACS